MSNAIFSVGNFTGRNGQSAARWLKKVTYELKKNSGRDEVPPKEFLQAVEFLLSDDAEDWIESHKEANNLLSIREPTQADVDKFVVLLEKKFPAKPKDTSRKGFVAELRELQQEANETITMYYKRVVNMMTQVDVRDRPTSTDDEDLNFLEESMLDNILEAFTRGFRDEYITKKTIQGLGDPNRSVLNTYNLAESVRLSQLAVREATGSKSKDRQRGFLWNLVKRHVPADKIESLYTSSQHQPIPEEWRSELSIGVAPTQKLDVTEPSGSSYRPPQLYVPNYFSKHLLPFMLYENLADDLAGLSLLLTMCSELAWLAVVYGVEDFCYSYIF